MELLVHLGEKGSVCSIVMVNPKGDRLGGRLRC